MRRSLVTVAMCVLVVGVVAGAGGADSKPAEPLLSHDVFFTLKDDSPESRQKLVDGCIDNLAGHDGIVFFSAGVLAEDLDREVNDQDFDVALHIVFRTKKDHDDYQTSPRHLAFVDQYLDKLKKVRVFDSYVESVPAR